MNAIITISTHLALFVFTLVFSTYVLLYRNSLKKIQRQIGIKLPPLIKVLMRTSMLVTLALLLLMFIILFKDFAA